MANGLLTHAAYAADHRIQYGAGQFQFGELWLPGGGVPAPVVVFVHGGWWKAEYGLEYARPLCAALKREGIATWSLEYRRVGNAGGGWPGTFEDVAAGYDYLAVLGKSYPLDLKRVVAMGHSAGGQLAFWLAGRSHLPEAGTLKRPVMMPAMRGVVALAGAVDLRMLLDLAGSHTFGKDKREVVEFMGGSPAEVPERYREGNPGDLLPLNVPQVLVQGTYDDQIPAQLPVRWAARGRQMGETVVVETIAGAEHQDVVNPGSSAWPRVRDAVKRLLFET